MCTDDVLVQEGVETTFIEAQIPKLTTVINDIRYLQEQRIFLFVFVTKENDIYQLIGQTSISLRKLMTQVGEQYGGANIEEKFELQSPVEFSGDLEAEGVQVGSVVGTWKFSV